MRVNANQSVDSDLLPLTTPVKSSCVNKLTAIMLVAVGVGSAVCGSVAIKAATETVGNNQTAMAMIASAALSVAIVTLGVAAQAILSNKTAQVENEQIENENGRVIEALKSVLESDLV